MPIWHTDILSLSGTEVVLVREGPRAGGGSSQRKKGSDYFTSPVKTMTLRDCAAKALFSCPAIISQRLEPRITSNEPLENTEEESKII